MKPDIQQKGKELAESIYAATKAEVFQVRDKQGRKLAEYDNPEETGAFLRDRNRKNLEVWLLNQMPGELLEICEGNHFLQKHLTNHK